MGVVGKAIVTGFLMPISFALCIFMYTTHVLDSFNKLHIVTISNIFKAISTIINQFIVTLHV